MRFFLLRIATLMVLALAGSWTGASATESLTILYTANSYGEYQPCPS